MCVYACLGICVEVREPQVLVLAFHLVKKQGLPHATYRRRQAAPSQGVLAFACHLPTGALVMLLNLRFPEVLGTQNQDVKLLWQIFSH